MPVSARAQVADDKASWVSFTERHTEHSVCFAFRHTARQLRQLRAMSEPSLRDAFHLEATHSLRNMHAFDAGTQSEGPISPDPRPISARSPPDLRRCGCLTAILLT